MEGYDGLKTSAGIDLTGMCKTDILKVAPQGLHLETAAVISTCECLVIKCNGPQLEMPLLSFNLLEILSVFGLTDVFPVESEAASAWKDSHK